MCCGLFCFAEDWLPTGPWSLGLKSLFECDLQVHIDSFMCIRNCFGRIPVCTKGEIRLVYQHAVGLKAASQCTFTRNYIFSFFFRSIHNIFHHGSPYVYASTFCRLPANQDKWTHGCGRFVFWINLRVNNSKIWYFRLIFVNGFASATSISLLMNSTFSLLSRHICPSAGLRISGVPENQNIMDWFQEHFCFCCSNCGWFSVYCCHFPYLRWYVSLH